MNLFIHVFDERHQRRANIHNRISAFMGQRFRDSGSIDYTVAMHTLDLKPSNLVLPPATDPVLLLLHHSSQSESFASMSWLLPKIAEWNAACATRTHKFIFYTGGHFGESTQNAVTTVLPGADVVFENEVLGDAELGTNSGRHTPAVETHLADLLGWQRPTPSHILPPPLKYPTDVSHVLINACGPLRAAVSQVSLKGRSATDLLGLWQAARARFESILHLCPPDVELAWSNVERLMGCISDLGTPDLTLLHNLQLDLGIIETHARRIGTDTTNWQEIESLLVSSWGDSPPRVLWIDDDAAWFGALKSPFEQCGLQITTSQSADPWLKQPDSVTQFDAIVLDLQLEEQGKRIAEVLRERSILGPEPVTDDNAGTGLLCLFRSVPQAPPIFMLSAREGPDVVAACIRFGAKGYFLKARSDYGALLTEVRDAIVTHRKQVNRSCTPMNPSIVVGGADDPLVNILKKFAARIASPSPTTMPCPVLLIGEPGVGKGELAKELHLRARPEGTPFITADLAATTESLAEDELFGHVKGAYSGATGTRRGKIEQANNGTLFLDEIDKASENLQKKLLGVLASGTFYPLGASTPVTSSFFLVAASNVDLREAVDAGQFYGPLYSRLKGLVCSIPSLKARCAALPQIATILCQSLCSSLGHPIRTLTDDAVLWLTEQARMGKFDGAEGNIRGLIFLIRLSVSGSNQTQFVTQQDLQDAVRDSTIARLDTDGNAKLKAAGRILADYVLSTTNPRLQAIEDSLRAELFKSLHERFQEDFRRQLASLFNWTRPYVRDLMNDLRRRNLLPPGI